MVDLTTWKKAWALLDADEKLNAWFVLGVTIFSALSSATMIGSVMPFLAVLSDPSRIEETSTLLWAYETLGFTSEYGFLVGLGLASFAAIVVSTVLQVLKTWSVARFAMMRMHSISKSLLSSYLAQPYAFFLNRHTGEMGPRVLDESQRVVGLFFQPAAEFFAACLTTIAIVGMLIWIDPVVASVAFFVLGGLYGLIYIVTRRVLKSLGQTRLEANKQRYRLANEALTGIKEIKLLGRESDYLALYEEPSIRMAQTQVKVSVISHVPQFALQAVALGGVILLCLALVKVEHPASGVTLSGILPTLGVFAFAGQRLMPELSKLYQTLAMIRVGSATVDAVYDDLTLRDSCHKQAQRKRLRLRQELRLEAISYSYPNSDQIGVGDITLSVRAGEKIGIVGSTGAGKTTLADVVLGLLEPDQGRLVVDKINITSENVRDWMQSVGYVPQEIFLTDATITENIALGVPPKDIDFERIRRAARTARIDQFITDDLADGYQTQIGERGVRLSGGQRQRIGVARALYHDTDLIVFDEATSALDNLTEAQVMEAIDALPDDKTVFMIAHRLSTVQQCDRILVLDRGRVVGFDNWPALMANNIFFQRIAQMGGPQ